MGNTLYINYDFIYKPWTNYGKNFETPNFEILKIVFCPLSLFNQINK